MRAYARPRQKWPLPTTILGRPNLPRVDKSFSGESRSLSCREQQVACALCRGLTLRQLSAFLDVSFETLRKHRSRLYGKLGVRSLAGLLQVMAPEPVFTPA